MAKRSFVLSKSFVNAYKDIKPSFGFNGLGELTYMRTYSRLKCNDCNSTDFDQKEEGLICRQCGSDYIRNEKWYETIQRVVEGTYSIQKDHINQYGLGWNEHKAQKSAQEMYDRMFNMKFLPPGRGLWAMGTRIIEERQIFASLNNCFGGDAELLTKQGIVKFKDVSGTIQEVLTHKGNWIKAPISSFGRQPISYLTLKRGKKTKTIPVTKDHRWIFKTFEGLIEKTTEQLQIGDTLPYQFGVKSPSVRPSAFGIAQGIVYGDGCKGHLYLCGEKDEELIKWFPLSPVIKDEDKCEGGALRVADLPTDWKKLPSIDESKSFLLGWLMGYFAADGHCSNSQVCLDSNDYRSVEFASIVATCLGIYHYGISEIKNSSSFKESYITYRLTFSKSSLDSNFFLIKKHRQEFEKSNKDETLIRHWKIDNIVHTEDIEEVYCATVEGYGTFTLADNILTGNCAFVSTDAIDKDLTKPFEFLMDMSMLGVGVGFDVKGAGKIKLRGDFQQKSTTVVIPDTREGWVESLKQLLLYFFNKTDVFPVFDYSQIRPKGAIISTFGGKSAGYKVLETLHKAIINQLINRSDYLTATDIVDIMNHIGVCVVAGNVRRTAEIVFGDPTDEEYLKLKDYRWNKDKEKFEGSRADRAGHGWASNNSVFVQLGQDYSKLAKQTSKNGEPGFAWLQNMQNYSRMNNGPDYKDFRVKGGNPCLEQSLESFELCCLVETFPTTHDNIDDFKRTLKFAYLYAKTVTLGQTHWWETNRVLLRNRRIGTSMSGIAQFIAQRGLNELKEWSQVGYDTIQRYDQVYSDWLCVPKSIKQTSIKPSGTVSLLPGVTPGIHYPENNYYIRRIRLAKESPYINICKDAGYHIEDDVVDKSSVVVEFPVKVDGVRTIDKVSIWEQASLAAFMQRYWADNQVSCTITFQPHEADQIEHVLNYYQYQLKGISFLPQIKKGGSYAQMPYEAINKEEYDEKSSKISLLNFDIMNKGEESKPELFCTNDKCETGSIK